MQPKLNLPKVQKADFDHSLISREESTYPQGNEFKPQRFLDPKYPTYKEPLTEFPNLIATIQTMKHLNPLQVCES